jgi:hypothetical protein
MSRPRTERKRHQTRPESRESQNENGEAAPGVTATSLLILGVIRVDSARSEQNTGRQITDHDGKSDPLAEAAENAGRDHDHRQILWISMPSVEADIFARVDACQ